MINKILVLIHYGFFRDFMVLLELEWSTFGKGDFMGRIIAVANQKGGVGKTTTAINLAACLAEKGQKVLAIDIDPQGNMTSGLGINKKKCKYTTYDLVLGKCELKECLSKSVMKDVMVLPSNPDLAAAEIELIGVDKKEFILKEHVDKVREDYDYVVIDCPPSLNTLTVNALTTADTVLVPIQCEYYALEGLYQLMHTIELVKKRLNPSLELEGAVFTMFDSRTNLSLQVVENVRKNLKGNIYNTIIPRNVKLAEAPSHGLPIILYDSKCNGAEGYRALAEEVIERDVREWYE